MNPHKSEFLNYGPYKNDIRFSALYTGQHENAEHCLFHRIRMEIMYAEILSIPLLMAFYVCIGG